MILLAIGPFLPSFSTQFGRGEGGEPLVARLFGRLEMMVVSTTKTAMILSNFEDCKLNGS